LVFYLKNKGKKDRLDNGKVKREKVKVKTRMI